MTTAGKGALELRAARNGKGVYSMRSFKPDDILLEFRGPVLEYDDIEDRSYVDDHCLQIGERTYMGPSGGLDDAVNHSCEPNAGLILNRKKPLLIAIKPIHEGDEVTWDYSTWMEEGHWEMACRCGSPACRKTIRDFHTLPKRLRETYIKRGVVAPFILERLKR